MITIYVIRKANVKYMEGATLDCWNHENLGRKLSTE